MKFFLVLCSLVSINTFSLVDYSDNDSRYQAPKKKNKFVAKNTKKARSSSRIKKRSSSRKGKKGFLTLETNYRGIKANSGSKLSAYELGVHVEAGHGLYADISYWQAQGKGDFFSGAENKEKGNFDFGLGFKWLEIGKGPGAVRFDLLLGYLMGESNSLVASSQDRKTVGVETIKHFGKVSLGLGYKLNILGKSGDANEILVGNINQIYGSLGILVSSDIQFAIDAGMTNIKNYTDGGSNLNEKVSFSFINPRLILGMTSYLSFELGLEYQIKKVKEEVSAGLNLWDLKGLYGNSINAGMIISI